MYIFPKCRRKQIQSHPLSTPFVLNIFHWQVAAPFMLFLSLKPPDQVLCQSHQWTLVFLPLLSDFILYSCPRINLNTKYKPTSPSFSPFCLYLLSLHSTSRNLRDWAWEDQVSFKEHGRKAKNIQPEGLCPWPGETSVPPSSFLFSFHSLLPLSRV